MISPVIATSERQDRPVSKLARAVTIATPAEGPSFGTAPAGTWMWMSVFPKRSSETPNCEAWLLMRLRAACADSFITSPICPVRRSWPLPSKPAASTKMISPPIGV